MHVKLVWHAVFGELSLLPAPFRYGRGYELLLLIQLPGSFPLPKPLYGRKQGAGRALVGRRGHAEGILQLTTLGVRTP